MARVNILKQVKSGERWRLVAIPRNRKAATIGRRCPRAATSSNGTSAASASAKPAAERRPRRRRSRGGASTSSKAARSG